MTSEQWNRTRELFFRLAELSPAERKNTLSRECADENAIRLEVEALLAAHDKHDILEPLNRSILMTAAQEIPVDARIGSVIGSYRIVRKVAEGGMGEVYEAVRDDGEFTKRVAIKLVRSGMPKNDLLSRFQREKQTLATLQHHNIAQLLDGGTTQDGVPFLVMEFVDGKRIDEYCDEHRLSIDERLSLFRTVCSAVQYAHQRLIVHRDLKPGNIFVSEEGAPKLLDFGIAKFLAEESSTDEVTRTGMNLFTPEYASPEQVRGEPITTASDIYSLGVLLYKLLCGQKPYEFRGPGIHDVTRSIVEDEVTKPSSKQSLIKTKDESGKVQRSLAGDLDDIVMMALRKEPMRRYPSADQFAEDIRRHLAGLPVIARKDSLGYRFTKFVGRNTIAVAASIVVFALLAGGVASSLWQARRAEHERDRAQAESEKAKQVISVLNEMLSAADLTRATKRDVTVAEVLEQASGRVESDFLNQPEIAADLLATIGSTYEGLQLFDKAEAAKQKVLQLRIQMFGNEHPKVAEALHNLGEFYHIVKEDRTAAESLFTKSLAVFRAFNQPSREFATTLNDYGVFVQDEQKYTLADSLFHAALTMYRQIPGDNRREIAASLHNLALNKDWQKDLNAADSLYRESLRIQRSVYGNDNVQIAVTLGNIGFIAEGRGDFPEAERLFRESLAIRRSLLRDDHSSVVGNKIKLGLFLVEHSTRYQEAEQLCREALAALIANNPNLTRLIARAHLGIGRALEKQGKKTEAELELRKAITHFLQMKPYNALSIADAELSLAENLIAQHRFRDAEAQLLKTQTTLKNASAESSDEMKKAVKLLLEINNNAKVARAGKR